MYLVFVGKINRNFKTQFLQNTNNIAGLEHERHFQCHRLREWNALLSLSVSSTLPAVRTTRKWNNWQYISSLVSG